MRGTSTNPEEEGIQQTNHATITFQQMGMWPGGIWPPLTNS